MAESNVRIPVIIYSGLSRKEETRLFIDINTKQKPVPNELLLDIKSLAEYENESESFLRNIFDAFQENPSSALYGKLSAAIKVKNKISRVTFNSSVKPLAAVFGDKEAEEVFKILNSYLIVIQIGFKNHSIEHMLLNPYVFRAIFSIFPDVAGKVKDRYNEYSIDNFSSILTYFFENINTAKVIKKHQGHKDLTEHFLTSLKRDFTL